MNERQSVLRGKRLEAIGTASEKTVAQAIAALRDVIAVRRTKKNSPEDQNGQDLIVDTDSELLGRQTIYIQVKSSTRLMRKFRERLIQTNNLDRNHFQDWLKERKIVLLMGQLPDYEIQRRFINQVKAINSYNSSRQH